MAFTVYSGYKVGLFILNDKRRIRYFYYLPLFAQVFLTISGGGRAGIVAAFLWFFLGFALGYFTQEKVTGHKLYQSLRPFIKYFVVFFLLFSMYSTFVSAQRAKSQQGLAKTPQVAMLTKKFPLLSPIAGTFEYLMFHFQGYQWRRDELSIKKPELGINTFAFVFQFNVPVISQLLGQNMSLANLFDIEYKSNVKSTQENIAAGVRGDSITATVYILLFKDFGFWGTLISIFIFVGFTQKIFERLFFRKNVDFWSIIFFLAIYKLWTLTFFNHHLNGAWFNGYLYPILFVEVANLFYMKRIKVAQSLPTSIAAK